MNRTRLTLGAAFFVASHAFAGTTLELNWNLNPGGAAYLGTSNTERGIAYNASTNHLLLASRSGGNHLVVLDAINGESVGEMSTAGITSGNGNAFNMIGVADDGVVYACNLIVAGANPGTFKIYRWDNDNTTAPTTPPTVAFTGDPSVTATTTFVSLRWGDTLAVRGSGANTQIICGSGSTAVAIFTTSDGLSFTSHFIDGALETGGSKGIAFGAGDTFYSKANGGTKKIRRSSFDLTAGTATVLNDFTVAPGTGTQIIPIALNLGKNWWGAFETGGSGPEAVKLFDVSSPGSTPTILHTLNLPNDNANANAVGSTALSDTMLFVCDTNNGIQGYNIVVTPDAVAPTISSSPASRSAYERGQTTFAVVVGSGTPPLTYTWFKDDVDLGAPNASSLTINPVGAASAGVYKCRVSNSAGFADSNGATLTVVPSVNSTALTECWHVSPGARAYLQNDDTQRGMDYDPANGRLYVVSRTPSPSVKVLNAATGADLYSLSVGDITNATLYPGANFPINMIGVADDGVIFACNLSNTTDGANFRLFRWADGEEFTLPTLVYQGDLFNSGAGGTRGGDTIDVRGAGTNTQIVVGARSRGQFAVFTTADGANFTPTVYTPAGVGASAFGLGVSFGEGSTLWGKASGSPLTYVNFDGAGDSTLLATIPTAGFASSAGAISADTANGCLGALAVENSDNVRLYALPNPWPNPAPSSLALLDQEFLATDNDNGNATGSVTLKNGKLFVLDSFNGLACYLVSKPTAPELSNLSYDTGAGQFTFTLKGEVGKSYLIQESPDMTSWTDSGVETLTTAEKSITRAAASPKHFFRARAQ